MKIAVYNQKGEETGVTLLPKEIFGVEMNPDLVHQVAVSQMANKRKVIANSKGRGEVRGGGRKPWRQKGTGRARHGSRRSPIWKGGGVTFGPTKERNFKKKINIKMRRKALLMVLSAKAKNDLLMVFDGISLTGSKTKLMAELVSGWKSKIKNFKEGSVLIVLSKLEKDIIRATGNIPNINTIEARNLNALDLLSFKYLILTKEGIKTIKEIFAK